MAETLVLHRNRDDLLDIRKSRKLAPDRETLRKMFPGRERVERDPVTGKETWVVDVVTHDRNGNQTADGRELTGAFRDFARAEGERGHKLRSRLPEPVRLRDQDGGVRYVQPVFAEQTARKNGWRHAPRIKGRLEMLTLKGVLWRRGEAGWQPETSPRTAGLHCAPDGAPWRFIAGDWAKAG